MKLSFKTLAAFIAVSSMMTGCANDDTAADGSSIPQMSAENSIAAPDDSTKDDSPKMEVVVDPADIKGAITFSGDNITASGSGAAVSGKTVKITKAGTYELTGSCEDCNILIEAGKDDRVTLVLNGVRLTAKTGCVLDCEKAKTLVLYSKDGTSNVFTDGETYTALGDTDPDAAVFTRSDLIVCGAGSLAVNGKYGDAVKCKDALSILEGDVTVTAADDGITGKDSVSISGGVLLVNANGDGIKSTNSEDADRGNIIVSGGKITVNSERDGIQAEKSLEISGGDITIKAGGDAADEEVKAQSSPWDRDKRNPMGGEAQSTETSESQKGLKAGGKITIGGAVLDITAADDSIHSNASVTINGGSLELSSCDDGIHADENLTITDGDIRISKSYEGLEGKSVDIAGGTITVRAADDGINAAGGDNGSYFGYGGASDEYYIRITGGEIVVDADGDGVDSNGTIAQSGGVLIVYGPTNSGNGAIDYERSYAMSGGTLIALGSQGMAQSPSTLSQPCFSVNAQAAAGSVIEVREGSEVILTATTSKAAQSLIFSDDKLKSGTEYGIYVNDELVYSGTAEDGVVGNGNNGGFGGGGFGNGGFGGGQGMPGGFGGGQGMPGGFGSGQGMPGGGRGDREPPGGFT